ncbi:PLP-dependent aminotransferase family protein [Undibacterium fentianense]|uniref:PLP-dependent aminotransferase family protein n=1 Tax=Undibacterium fentianense TaxID=2828728 RepID=A0A941E7U5_9BURK|nr:PLP-dependent aminotransferase family protein [Undibacterium fentianense]MBR7801343.1 PLP-dependent aminotransferase family protein [Undibacterium fentianense]
MDFALLLEMWRQISMEDTKRISTQRRLHAMIRNAIQTGVLYAGSRLPASRILAAELGIARNTVVYAYEQLISEGFLHASRRGSVVNANIQVSSSLNDLAPVTSKDHALSRRSQQILPLPVAASLHTAFAPGVPSVRDFPKDRWRKMLDAVWRALPADCLDYGDACGEMVLREAISSYLRSSRGVNCDPMQVIITDGTQSSLQFCAEALADPADLIWMESPGYIGAQNAFRSAGLKIKGIRVDQDGLAPRRSDWKSVSPRIIYVTPSHQYPIGQVMSLERRLALIHAAQQHACLIIEDDYDSEFRHDGPPLPSMQGLVEHAPVIYLGTFSKTMFPDLRIGFMVVPKNLVAPLSELAARQLLRGRTADQLCLARFIQEGDFLRHLRRMRRLYRQRRDCLVALLEHTFSDIASLYGSTAGMHLSLCFHNQTIDDVAVSAAALADGLIVPALSRHNIGSKDRWCGLMLGYAQVPIEEMPLLIARLEKRIRPFF